MSVRIREDEVEGLTNSPPTTIIQEVVDAARKGYCKLYSESPSWALAKNTIIIPIVTRTLDRFCGDFPPPPPPPPIPFEGGQCPERYTISVDYNVIPQGGGEPVARSTSLFASVGGPIKDLTNNATEGGGNFIVTVFTTSSPNGSTAVVSLPSGSQIVPSSIQYVLVRPDGLPDDCGSLPPPPYPELPPPTKEERSFEVSVTNNNSVTNNYSGVINASLSGQVTFPPVINIAGVSVTLDIGGAVVSNTTNDFSGGGGVEGGDKVTDELDPPPPPTIEEQQEEEEQPEPKTVENLIAILINANGNGKVYPSTAGRGSPDRFRIGWVEFKNGGFYYPKKFIEFEQSRFQAPEENDGYAITYNKGWSGTVTEITEKAEEPSES